MRYIKGFQVKIIIFSRMSNTEWQENESEINVCLGKLPLFIHVSSRSYVWGEGLLWKKITGPHANKHN